MNFDTLQKLLVEIEAMNPVIGNLKLSVLNQENSVPHKSPGQVRERHQCFLILFHLE